MSRRVCKPCKPSYKQPSWRPILAYQGSAEGISPHPPGNPTKLQRHRQREHPPNGHYPATTQHQGQHPIIRRSHCLRGNYWCLDCSRKHRDLSGPGNGAVLCDKADPGKRGHSHTPCRALPIQEWPTTASEAKQRRNVSWFFLHISMLPKHAGERMTSYR